MKSSIINLIKTSTQTSKFRKIEEIFSLYEQLQYSKSIKQLSHDLYDWLKIHYKINNVTISLFNTQENSKENIFVEGKEFFLDDSMSLFFIINTHTNQNAIVSFSACDKAHLNELNLKYDELQATFLLISPIIESRILRKNFIQSQSIDSVTNVYNRQYLTKHVNKIISLSGKNYSRIYLLMVSVDRLKAVIDEFDYDTGDKVLVQLANILHSNIEDYDLVARVTGDDFLVALTSCNDSNRVENIIKKIILDFSKVEIPVENDCILKKTACIGYDYLDVNSDKKLDDIIKNADTALYEAKNQGRSCFKAFTDLTEEESIELF